MTDLTSPIYTDEEKAREYLENQRWPHGPVCPHCGVTGEHVRPLNGKSMGAGWYYCVECQDKFTVRVGSIFERSHIPLRKWLLAFRLMAGSKKGVSAHQLHRSLGITYKSAWFMAHRVREAMRDGPYSPPLGGAGKVVEADETYIGNKKGRRRSKGPGHKHAVLTLIERGGKARSFHISRAKLHTIVPLVKQNIAKESRLATDEAAHYDAAGTYFADHLTVHHAAHEYVDGDAFTNTAEGFFSIFKRGMKGIYQHCGEQHLHRYLAEFDFRYNNRVALGVDDAARTTKAIRGASGKRLTYQGTYSRPARSPRA